MRAPNPAGRKLTELDFARLQKLTSADAPTLADILNDADVVPAHAIPADLVTMYARFVILDLKLQCRQILVICYPSEAEPRDGFISVLSPAGTGLLGLPEGALARWVGPRGEERVVRIERVLFQPEASGDYLM